MKTVFLAIFSLAIVTGCAPLSDDVAGNVVSFTDTMVVIEAYGGFHPDDYRAPPSAMQAQAQELCASRKRSARFLSADLEDTGARTVVGPFGTTYVSGSQAIASVQYKFACV